MKVTTSSFGTVLCEQSLRSTISSFYSTSPYCSLISICQRSLRPHCRQHPLAPSQTHPSATRSSLCPPLPTQDTLRLKHSRLLPSPQHPRPACPRCLQQFYPLLEGAVGQAKRRSCNEVPSGLRDAKEWADPVEFGVRGLEQGKETVAVPGYFLLEGQEALLGGAFLDESSLSATVEAALTVVAVPASAEAVGELPATVHEVVLPMSCVKGAVGEVEGATAVVLSLLPLALVDRTVGVVVGPEALHLVLPPVALVALARQFPFRGHRHSPIALPVLPPLRGDPVPLVDRPAEVFEPAEVGEFVGLRRGLGLLGGFFGLGVLFGRHAIGKFQLL
jgi:hypothetical protein